MNGKWKEAIAVIVAIILFIFYIIINDPFTALSLLESKIKWNFIGMASILSLLAFLMMGFRFWLMTHTSSEQFNLSTSLRIHLITPILGRITPANIGESYKITNQYLERRQAAFVHLMERISDFTVLLFASTWIVYVLGYLDFVQWVSKIIFLGFGVLLLVLLKVETIVNFMAKQFSSSLRLEKGWFVNQIKLISTLRWVQFNALSISVFIITIGMYNFLQLSIGVSIPLFSLAVIIATAVVIISLSGLPGGFGIREFSLTFLFTQYGLTLDIAISFTALITIYLVSIELLSLMIGLLFRKFQ